MDREYDSSANLDHLLDRVERGEAVYLSRKGKMVAKIVRVRKPTEAEMDEAIDGLLTLRKRHNLQGSMTTEEIVALKNEGRRFV
jgi:antitoxin (DNA-binding transcriptional repressor) of toxin-antitoxin stability system